MPLQFPAFEYLTYFLITAALVGLVVLFVLMSGKVISDLFREKTLSQVAQEMSFSFMLELDPLLREHFSRFHLFAQRTSRGASPVLRGRVGVTEVVLFDHNYADGEFTSSETVVAFCVDKGALPIFQLMPKGVFQKALSPFGHTGIVLKTNPEFSRNYLLLGSDDQAIRDLFNSHVLNFFKQHKGWSVEGRGSWLVVYRESKRVKPKTIRNFLEEAMSVFRSFSKS